MGRKKKSFYLEGKGVSHLRDQANQKILDRNKDLEYYKDVIYQCGKCGTCRTTYQEDWWLNVCPSGEFRKFEAYYLGGKNLLTWALTSKKLDWTENMAKIFYECTLCLACTQQCQIPEIHHYAGEWLMAMREKAVERRIGPLLEHDIYTAHILAKHNPYRENHEDRTLWMPLNLSSTYSSQTAYFVGCTASYREKSVAVATAEILSLLDIQHKVIKDERCCGSPIYMTGQTEKARKVAEANIKIFKETGTKRLITSCAGCYRMFKDIYPNKFGIGHELEVFHITEIIQEKLNSGELHFNKEVKMKITYHDPCHIGRHMGLYEPPREILKKIPGIELIEMYRNKHNAWCCGSGGGVRAGFEEMSSFAAEERIEEAKLTKAEAIVSACPFCLNQFKANIKNNDLKAFDISEIVRKALYRKM